MHSATLYQAWNAVMDKLYSANLGIHYIIKPRTNCTTAQASAISPVKIFGIHTVISTIDFVAGRRNSDDDLGTLVRVGIAELSNYGGLMPILSYVGLKRDSFGFFDETFNIDKWMYETMAQIIGMRSEKERSLGYRFQFVGLYENATDEQRAQFLRETRFGQLYQDRVETTARRWDKSPFQGLPAIGITREDDVKSFLRPKEIQF